MNLSVLDLRVWLAALTLGLAASLWVLTTERDAAQGRAKSLTTEVNVLRADLDTRSSDLRQARAHAAASDARLTDYAAATAQAFQDQAAASAKMAAELADVNRRLRAAQMEISRADAGLRLDDPLPRVVRDGLACAGGDAAACDGPATANPGVLPPGAAGPAAHAVALAPGADRA